MTPQTNYDADIALTIAIEPSYTYKLNYDTTGRVVGYRDDLEAVKQAIYKMLHTERYQHAIYSWNYGVELQDLFGKPKPYVYAELKHRISEALIQDDRINRVDNFSFEKATSRNAVLVKVTAYTIFGEIESERTVNY